MDQLTPKSSAHSKQTDNMALTQEEQWQSWEENRARVQMAKEIGYWQMDHFCLVGEPLFPELLEMAGLRKTNMTLLLKLSFPRLVQNLQSVDLSLSWWKRDGKHQVNKKGTEQEMADTPTWEAGMLRGIPSHAGCWTLPSRAGCQTPPSRPGR